MATISATDVKKLRDATGAGMMDSKRALEEAGGDFDKAVEVLRVRGSAKAAKRGAERTAANGLVAAAENAMIELASETDFVAKNEQFQTLAGDIVAHFAGSTADDVDSLLGERLADGRTVAENIEALAAVIGEKLELRRAVKLPGTVASYLHRKASDLPPQVGVLVQFTGQDVSAARGAAMQVAAMRPRYLRREDVPDGRHRQRAAHCRGGRPRRGQARAGAGQDRRWPAQRILQGHGAARAARSAGQQAKCAGRPG